MIGRQTGRRRVAVTLALALAAWAGRAQHLQAQEAEVNIGRLFDSTEWTSYRLGVTRPLRGVFRVQLHGDVLRRVGGLGTLAGLGTDLTAFRSGGQGPYLVAGLSGGLGSESSNDFSDLWGSWSAGVGIRLCSRFRSCPLGPKGDGGGCRSPGSKGWSWLSGWPSTAVGARLLRNARGRRFRRPEHSLLPETVTSSSRPAAGLQPRPETLADSIIATATEVMGRPYTYGGTGADGEGFDCSGLIQYAYGKHGIALPRRSTDQAREGRKIDRELKRLAPADILTFSNRGGQVTHVGLYIGEGRFIHSATRGVQVSILSAEDPYGRWWYKRWVGVRRIVR